MAEEFNAAKSRLGTGTRALEKELTDGMTKPGGITPGDLANILNKTLPADRKVVIQPISEITTGKVEAPLSKVYDILDYNKDVVITEQIITEGLWPSSVGTISDGAFYTSSVQTASSSVYYRTVVDGTTTASNALFDVFYSSLTSLVSSSQTLYKQLANTLLSSGDYNFTFNTGIDVDSIICLSVKRSLYQEKLDPNNWMLKVYSGSTTMSLVDDSGETTSTKTVVGERVNVMSGSIGVTVGTNKWGFAYPDMGLIVLDGDQFATSCSYSSSLDFIDNLDYFQARSEYRLKDMNYFIRIFNKDYNYSNNPTFITGSVGKFRHSGFSTDPHVYITTVGLYNDNNELLAIAKLSKPIEKTFAKESVVRVKLSFAFIPIFFISMYYDAMNHIISNIPIVNKIINWISDII